MIQLERVSDLVGNYYNSELEDNKGFILGLYTIDESNLNIFYKIMRAAGITPWEADDYYFNIHSCSKKISNAFLRAASHKADLNHITEGRLNQDLMQYVVDMFVIKFKNKYTRYMQIFETTYSPIENYDRYEELLKEYDESGENATDNTTTNTGTQTNVSKIEGFNSTGFDDSDQNIRTDNLSNVLDSDTSYGKEGSETNTNHIHGNIGVTKNEDMLLAYQEFWSKFNLLDIICDDIDSIITKHTY